MQVRGRGGGTKKKKGEQETKFVKNSGKQLSV